MSQYILDFGLDWNIILWNILVPLFVAFIISGYVGLERQNVGKAAGISAHILVGISSATIAIMQRFMFQQQIDLGFDSPEGQRVIAQVVTGVGFIGAGVILKDNKNIIRGITTAATIWAVAMICLVIGSGYLILGSISGLVVIIFITVRDIKRGINPFVPLPHNHEDHS